MLPGHTPSTFFFFFSEHICTRTATVSYRFSSPICTPAQTNRRPQRFASDVQPSALFVELEDAATSAAAEASAAGAGRHPSPAAGDERPRSAAVGGFWFGLDTRHVEDAPGLAVIKRHPGGLEPAKRRPLQSQLQVQPPHTRKKYLSFDVVGVCIS